MLAFLMKGEKLATEHGSPIRLIVPGLYGIKNVKWIVEIEVYPGDYNGYWQRKSWTDDGTSRLSRVSTRPDITKPYAVKSTRLEVSRSADRTASAKWS